MPATSANQNIALIDLNDGRSIPQIGFGVWQVQNDEATTAVREAFKAGYRSIDTAQGYDNEEGVDVAIKRAGLDRSEVFVTSKIRTIGVANFTATYLERMIEETGVVPVINQVETHPLYQQRDLTDFHARNKIQLEAYSPLGTGAVLKNGTIGSIAQKHDRSAAQVILKWHLRMGHVVIPKSVHPDRIRSNLDLFDFDLDADDIRAIDALDDPNGKTGSRPEEFNDLY